MGINNQIIRESQAEMRRANEYATKMAMVESSKHKAETVQPVQAIMPKAPMPDDVFVCLSMCAAYLFCGM